MCLRELVAALADKFGVTIDVGPPATVVSGRALCAPRSDGLIRGTIPDKVPEYFPQTLTASLMRIYKELAS
jgi:hypothetical protein